VRIADGLVDPLVANPGVAPRVGEPAERGVPRREVGDGVLDVQCPHCRS
jgi:hypothetical protein